MRLTTLHHFHHHAGSRHARETCVAVATALSPTGCVIRVGTPRGTNSGLDFVRRTIEDPDFLRNLAARLARLGVDAEDALSDTVAELLLDAVALRFDPTRGTLLDFAAGIGRRLSANRRRRQRRIREVGEFPELESPARRCPVEEADELGRLRAALEQLPARDRELIERRYGVGSAEPLPTPVGGSDRGRLARAREKLRELLAGGGGEPD